jgi:hypothetical protein
MDHAQSVVIMLSVRLQLLDILRTTGKKQELHVNQPMSMRIADEMRAKIKAGEYAAHSTLPTQSTLADHYNVSYPTIAAVYRALEADGLIKRQHRRGVYVAAELVCPSPRDRLVRFNSAGAVLPEGGSSKWLRSGRLNPADDKSFALGEDLAVALDMAEGDMVAHRTRITRDRSGRALAVSTSYRPVDLVDTEAWDSGGRLRDGGIPHAIAVLDARFDSAGSVRHGTDLFATVAARGVEVEEFGAASGSPLLASSNRWRYTTGDGDAADVVTVEYGETVYAPGVRVSTDYVALPSSGAMVERVLA